ncbi:tetrahydromethanopterin S-methyltransferase subunit H family protein [Archaeoglobus neptunius]|uniref:tetrahydromethanopterin S-methyltransferase subunit H family protein n=1 Tax=Archaeoglobus neptunius TaxID=2798580 RepID=UPI00192869E6|nr:tetrahydromethanopterin S-methyltransferase subunit H [Archaeoglobus neptunius]
MKDKTFLIGSIFYSRHSVVEDPEKGVFDAARAEYLINRQEELSDAYQIPSTLDVVAESGEAMVKYLDFILDHYDKPFILDGYVDARIAGLRYASEHGVVDRIIYNSISTMNTKDELKLVKEVGVSKAIIFCYDPSYTTPPRRFTLLSGDAKREGLITRAKKLGIRELLIDVVPTDIKSLGEVIETLLVVKSAYDYPAGCGPANVSYYMAEYLKKELDTKVLVSSVDSVAQLFSDFLFYGPIERCDVAFESASIIEEVKTGLSVPLHRVISR